MMKTFFLHVLEKWCCCCDVQWLQNWDFFMWERFEHSLPRLISVLRFHVHYSGKALFAQICYFKWQQFCNHYFRCSFESLFNFWHPKRRQTWFTLKLNTYWSKFMNYFCKPWKLLCMIAISHLKGSDSTFIKIWKTIFQKQS